MRDAPRADQKIDGLADRNAAPAQKSKICRRHDRDGIASHSHNLEAPQQSLDLLRLALAAEALENLAKHQIAKRDLILAEDRAQLPHMRRVTPAEKVDPDAAV